MMIKHIHSFILKKLDSSCSGTNVWIAQRVSALALIPLTCWFVIFLINALSMQEIDQFSSIFTSPFPTIFLALFIVFGIYHGNLGVTEIIEDYVHSPMIKFVLINIVKFISIVTAIIGTCSILVLHLSTFVFN